METMGGNFFCHKVPAVIATKAVQDAIKPTKGNVSKALIPKTNNVPLKPKKIPTHCLHVTTSPSKGPANKEVRMGCMVTINATIPAGIP